MVVALLLARMTLLAGGIQANVILEMQLQSSHLNQRDYHAHVRILACLLHPHYYPAIPHCQVTVACFAM